jgi:hypothetical protein
MAKKKPYSSVGLDDDIYNNPGLLQSDAMKRIEQEQGESSPKESEPVAAVNEKNNTPAPPPVIPEPPKNDVPEEVNEAEKAPKPKKKDAGYQVRDIFSKDNLSEKDFTSAILHNDILEELHELARIRDDEGKRYPVKYLASNIIRNYLNDHKAEIESLKTEFKNRRN